MFIHYGAGVKKHRPRRCRVPGAAVPRAVPRAVLGAGGRGACRVPCRGAVPGAVPGAVRGAVPGASEARPCFRGTESTGSRRRSRGRPIPELAPPRLVANDDGRHRLRGAGVFREARTWQSAHNGRTRDGGSSRTLLPDFVARKRPHPESDRRTFDPLGRRNPQPARTPRASVRLRAETPRDPDSAGRPRCSSTATVVPAHPAPRTRHGTRHPRTQHRTRHRGTVAPGTRTISTSSKSPLVGTWQR